MLFEKFFRNLTGEPAFKISKEIDINPLSGTKKIRILCKPNKAMEKLHLALRLYLKCFKIPLQFAAGCVPGSSPKNNVLKHRKSRFFYLLDLKDAYPSVDMKKLAQILCQQVDKRLIGYENEVLEFLRKYCMSPRGGLAIGANASPDLFNAYCAFAIDLELGELCEKWNIIYTRYLDDFTFSSLQPIGKRKRKTLRQVIESAGFKINHRKAKVYDLAKGPIAINGIGLRFGGKTFCPGHYKRKIKGLMNKALSSKEITPAMIHGRMGVFLPVTDPRKLNQSEKKILSKYQIFKNLIKN